MQTFEHFWLMIILMLLKTLSKKKNVDLNLDWLKKYEKCF